LTQEVFRFHHQFVVKQRPTSYQHVENRGNHFYEYLTRKKEQYVFLKNGKSKQNHGSFMCNRSNTFVGRLGLSAPPPVYPHSSPTRYPVICPFGVIVPVFAHRTTVIVASM
jgi:hypothetical protein